MKMKRNCTFIRHTPQMKQTFPSIGHKSHWGVDTDFEGNYMNDYDILQKC